MYLKRFIAVSACVAILLPSFAFAGDGSEAAKADSGSSFGDKNAGHGLSGPGAVLASMGLKKNSVVLSATVKNKTAKVPAPSDARIQHSAGGLDTPHRPASPMAVLATVAISTLIGAGIGAVVAAPFGAVLGMGIGAIAPIFLTTLRRLPESPPSPVRSEWQR